MAQQTINVGTTANDGTGDALRSAFQKVNANDTELYAAAASNATAISGKADASATTTALAGKVDTSAIDTDSTMAANSDTKVPSQKAVKTALDALSMGRELLTAGKTYYVRADGNDSNNGLANTSGGAFATLQKAINAATALDMSIYKTTIQLGDGTYPAGGAFTTSPNGPIIISGNATTPANVIVQGTASITAACPCDVTVQNFKTAGSSYDLHCTAPGAKITLGAGMILAGSGVAMAADSLSAISSDSKALTISGSKTAWLLAGGNSSVVLTGMTFNFTGTPAWSSYGIGFNTGAAITLTGTITGSATGLRYYGTTNAVLNTGGAGTASTYFPGSSDGSTASGAQQI